MTSISTLGQSLEQIDRLQTLQTDLATLQRQLASGKKARTFVGLDTGAIQSKRSRANFSQLDTYLKNIQTADRRMTMMTSALGQLTTQTASLQSGFAAQTREGDINITDIGKFARNVKTFAMDLINTKDGNRYLFGGADTENPPLKQSGLLNNFAQSQINDWLDETIDTDTLIANYTNRAKLNDTSVGFSTALSSSNTQSITVRVEENTEIDYTVLGNNDAFRDIMVVTTMISELEQTLDSISSSPDDPMGTVTAPGVSTSQQNENFFKVFNDLSNKLNTALDNLNNETLTVSRAQAQIKTIRESHTLQQNILLDQIQDVEDVDQSEVAIKLNSLSIQLEASYRVTASLRDLSIANFI